MSLQEFNHLTNMLEKIADLQADLQKRESDLVKLKQNKKSLNGKIRHARKKLEEHESGSTVTKAFTKSETEFAKLARFFDEPDIGLASRSMSHWKSKVKEVYPDPSKSNKHTTKTVLTAEQASKKYTIAFSALALAVVSILLMSTPKFNCESGNETVPYFYVDDGDDDCADGSDERAEFDFPKAMTNAFGGCLVCFWLPGLLFFIPQIGNDWVLALDPEKGNDVAKTSEREMALTLLQNYVNARSSFNAIKKSNPEKEEIRRDDLMRLERSLVKIETKIAGHKVRIDSIPVEIQTCIDSIEHLVPSTN